MAKGISAILAILMVLVIAVALSITLYGYVSGLFDRYFSASVEFVDAACSLDNMVYYATIRNTGSTPIQSADIRINVDGLPADGILWDVQELYTGGGIGTGEIPGGAKGTHRVRIIDPISQPQELVVVC